MLSSKPWFAAPAFWLLLYCQTLSAYELGSNIDLHGYFNAGYLQTSDNTYLSAGPKGSWDYYSGALLLSASFTEKSRFWVQGFTSSSGPNRTHIDWAFLDYQSSDNLSLRAGQIKTPLGLYNEIRDIEFTRPSSMRPALYNEAAEFTSEAFQGGSIVLEHELGKGSLTWDAFAGRSLEYQPPEYYHKNLAGTRLTYATPLAGLKLMYSGYSEELEVIDTGEKGIVIASILSLEYLDNQIDIKSELAQKSTLNKQQTTGYFQFAYTISEIWTPFFRLDYISTDNSQQDDPSYFQRTTSAGLGYKFNRSLSLRAEYHQHYGYALPVASGEVSAGAGKPHWQMFAASLSMLF